MIRPALRVFVILAAVLCSSRDVPARSTVEIQVAARHGKSVRGTFDGIPVMLLRGSVQERGRDHGYFCAREILKLIEAFIPVVKAAKGGDWDRDFVAAARRFTWPKRYEEELTALLAGVREALPEKSARTIAGLNREIGLDDLRVINSLADLFGMGCSSFSVWGDLTEDGQTLTARNADYTTFPIPLTTCIVALQPSEKDQKATLSAGFMGLLASGTVLSSDGVFAAVHDEGGLPQEGGKGFSPRILSVQAAVEAARADHAAGDMAAALRRSPVAVGNNIHVSAPLQPGRDESLPAVLEWDGNAKEQGVTVRPPRAEEFKSALVCTNHYRTRADRNAGCDRYARLSEGLRKRAADGRKVDLAAAQQLLDGVARNGSSMTYLSVVVFPKARRMVVAFAPQSGISSTKGRWVTVDWDAVFKN